MSLQFAESDRPRKALIYCRVSGKKQTKDGSGLHSQEHRCRQYAEAKGYEVEAVFPDDVSGGGDFMKRKGMVALLRYLDEHPYEHYVVIFDDLKRYSRDVEFHLKLRRLMMERNATRECLNFNFEDSPEGKFNETITAAAGAYERESMGRQNRQKAIARVEQGYCVQSVPPIGYKYQKSDAGGKVLVREEPYASIVQEALMGYATGQFASQSEVTRFLNDHPQFPKRSPSGRLTQHTVVKMLRQKLYAGIVGVPKWGVADRKGKHEGLISVELFQRIQDKLDGRVYAPTRKDTAKDFPLRGAVCCSECATPLTAGWSKGKYKKYPYYFCRNSKCVAYGKTVARQKIEGEFEDLLSTLQPSAPLLKVATAMFKDLWNERLAQSADMAKALKGELKALETKIEQVVDAVVEATNPRVISAFEQRIVKLEREKLVLQEKQGKLGQEGPKPEELLELSLRFLSNPRKIWESGKIELQRLVLRLAFPGHLEYCREGGFRTPQTTMPFAVFGGFDGPKMQMVPRGRIELPTSSLPMMRSTTELPRRLQLQKAAFSLSDPT